MRRGKVWYDTKRQTWRLFFPPNIYKQNKYDRTPLKIELDEMRSHYNKGIFDERDYQKSQPLGFANLAEQWLEDKKRELRCIRNPRDHIAKAIHFFGNQNIKTIRYAQLNDFDRYLTQYISPKTKRTLSAKARKNVFTTLHTFWQDIVDREADGSNPITIPKFPKIKYELKRRTTITRKQQLQVLDWLKENAPFKVWLGIKWLMTYISIRPGELINIKEGDINREEGVIYVRSTKQRSTHCIPFLTEDIEIIHRQPSSLSQPYFFRHETTTYNNQYNYKGQRFGKDYLYSWWKRACRNRGLGNVDLYGGTRHSTAQWLRLQGRTPEEIKRATMHSTTAAFNRYFEMELEDLREIYGTGQVVELQQAPNKSNKGEK